MQAQSQLHRERQRLLEEIGALGTMRKGSVTRQSLPYRRKDGTTRRRGPYLTYTYKAAGKTRGKHLRGEEEAEVFRRQIRAYRQYQDLSAQLVDVCHRLADLEAAGATGKKNSKR